MIGRLSAAYVDRLAADRGVFAFLKWFVLGVLLQLAFMIPALPFLALGLVFEGEAGRILATIGFVVVFLASRVVLFVLPCAAVAGRKGLGDRTTWGFGAFFFGPFALALAAALPPKASEGASA